MTRTKELNHDTPLAKTEISVHPGDFSTRALPVSGRQDRPLVVFCMEWVPAYRQAFYELLKPKLASMGIDMLVVHGAPPASRRKRNDSVEPPWATFVNNKQARIKGIELTWQPVWRFARRAELVIVQQEAALLFNYLALAYRRAGGPLVAMWGHGENPNPASTNSVAEAIKRRATPLADWFFAYTDRSASIAHELGIDHGQITVVNNARTSDAVSYDADDVDPELAQLLAAVQRRSAHIGWMVSALDTWKRLPFLIETLDEIRARTLDFEFFVLGQGDDAHLVFEAAETRPWLHALGTRFGADKAAVGAAAHFTLQPGLVGLHVVDAFAFETPMISVRNEIHSHEFDYLVDGRNSLILPEGSSATELAEATSSLLESPDRLARLRAGCQRSADVYTIESMVERYANGIAKALASR